MTAGEAPSDETLVRLALGGDAQAFAAIVTRYKVPLYQFIRRYVRDDDDAYDLLQQAYLSAWLSLSRYDLERSLRTWLHTIALNKCRDHARKMKVRGLFSVIGLAGEASNVADHRPSAVDGLLREERERAFADAIAGLPRQLKEPLVLTVFSELSQAEAGRHLGISAKAVETRVARARRKLADVLDQSTLGRNDNDT